MLHQCKYLILLCLLLVGNLSAQTLGGKAAYNFLSQSNSALLSSLGGVNISDISNDASMSFNNPSLLRNQMHGQISSSFNSFLAGIRNYSLIAAYHVPNANMGVGVNYFDYGIITQTDAAGNILGTFKPVDYVSQIMFSKQYHEKFWYGMTAKFIQSNYGQYRSAALAFDVGVSYFDSTSQMQFSVLVKNMGTQLSTYDGSNAKEELPFDLQAGITKKLANAPIQLSLTAHHLQIIHLLYNDTTFRAAEGDDAFHSSNALQNIVAHLVVGAKFFLRDKMELTAGYNFLRRQDLNIYQVSTGLSGFSIGAGIGSKKLHIRYATGFYQSNLFHQLTLNLNWKGNE
jgi:hypothetical protein